MDYETFSHLQKLILDECKTALKTRIFQEFEKYMSMLEQHQDNYLKNQKQKVEVMKKITSRKSRDEGGYSR